MSVSITAEWDKSGIASLDTAKLKAAAKRALRRAGSTALRDMRGEASKRIRARKRIKSKYITRALTLRTPMKLPTHVGLTIEHNPARAELPDRR